MLNQHFVFLAAALDIVGSAIYAVATVQGRARPNRVTWTLWALAPLIAFAAELKEGVGLPAVLTFVVGFGPLMVLLASFASRTAFWNIGPLDIACGVLSLLALAVWVVTRTGNLALIFSIVADALAAYPTIIKAYRHPDSEHAGVFALGLLAAVITAFTVRQWTFASMSWPLYIAAVCALIAALITWSPHRSSGSHQSVITRRRGKVPLTFRR